LKLGLSPIGLFREGCSRGNSNKTRIETV